MPVLMKHASTTKSLWVFFETRALSSMKYKNPENYPGFWYLATIILRLMDQRILCHFWFSQEIKNGPCCL